MLKKKVLLPIAFGLILTLTACGTTDDVDVDPDVDTPPAVEDQAPEDEMEDAPEEEVPGEDVEDEETP